MTIQIVVGKLLNHPSLDNNHMNSDFTTVLSCCLLQAFFFFFNCQTANSSRILAFYFADIYSTVRINYPYLMELERVEYIKLDLEHLFQFVRSGKV